MNTLSARRRHPAVAAALLVLALALTGTLYALISSAATAEAAPVAAGQNTVEEGRQLYLEGCSSCHGLEAQGGTQAPTLVGVGAAAADFQVRTGRMPMAQQGVQAPSKRGQYTDDEIAALAAYVASLAPGPAIPTAEQLDYTGADAALGGELFRANCSQCHQAAGQGGPLTQGKYAPNLMKATPGEIYMAMLTGPQSMPVFNDATLPTKDKQAIIKYIRTLQEPVDTGGVGLGRFGPVTEGLFLWTAGLGALIAAAVWIGVKAK